MKTLVLIFASLILLTSAVDKNAQDDIFNNISFSLKNSDAKGISDYFDSSIELTILDKEGIYSKTQAELMVKNFFEKVGPKAFEIKHKGTSGTNDLYAIGMLQGSSGNYRTFISMKRKNGKSFIQELRFEKD